MNIELALKELQEKQRHTAEQRAHALTQNQTQRAEYLREELKHLLDLEEKFLVIVADMYGALGKSTHNLHLPKRHEINMRPVSRSFPPGTRLQTTYKGKTIRATVNGNGKIMYSGKLYNSIAAVSHVVTGKEKNHLRNRKFWAIDMPGQS